MASSPKRLPRFLTEEEVHRMFDIAKDAYNPRDIKILKILYYFGLRNNEMCGLDVEHINFRDLTLKVVQGKGRKDRIIPIIEINPLPGEDKTIADDLREWVGRRRSGLLIEGASSKGGISDRHVRRIVKEYATRARIRNWQEIHPHTLRHSYATHLMNLGVPLEFIQKLLGHVKPETTEIYAHIGVENLRSEINRHIWTARLKREIPAIMKALRNERDPQKKLLLQQDLIIKGLLVQLGIPPQ